MKQYKDLLNHILENGALKEDRTGTGTLSVFGYQMRFNLKDGFPLVTTKKIHFKSVLHELIWFLSGNTNVKYLQDNGVKIWNDWADKNGELGKVYGHQWRSWSANGKSIDQIKNVIQSIKQNPNSRRHIVSTWNVADLEEMKLPPCHCFFQFYVQGGKLSCQLYQRSADVFLGVPFNIASYAALTMLIAKVCNLDVGEFIHTLGDAHIYSNHLEQVQIQLQRDCKPLPTLEIISGKENVFEYVYEDFKLLDYISHPSIKGKVAI